jgi:hypothetical protein
MAEDTGMSLNEDDKSWIVAQIAREREWMTAMMTSMFERQREWTLSTMTSMLNSEREVTKAMLERVETSLLTAFHQWASPMEMRARSHAAVLRAHDVELESVSERVTKLEGSK